MQNRLTASELEGSHATFEVNTALGLWVQDRGQRPKPSGFSLH